LYRRCHLVFVLSFSARLLLDILRIVKYVGMNCKLF